MAGSKKPMIYLDDSGSRHGVEIDESNGRDMGFISPTDQELSSWEVIEKPPSLQMRYVIWSGKTSDGRVVKRKTPVGSIDNQFYRQGGTMSFLVNNGRLKADAEDVTFTATYAGGEKRVLGKARDTGILDKTAD